jgi:hypothetical protein
LRRGRGEPGVLADDEPAANPVDIDDARRVARHEGSLLVEHRVVRQDLLAVDRFDAALAKSAIALWRRPSRRSGKPTTTGTSRTSDASAASSLAHASRNAGRSTRSSGG